MRATLPAFMPELFKHEGGYVDHPRDPGGATNLGITIETLRAWRKAPVSKADVKALSKAEATEIYRERYWNAIRADHIPAGPDAMLFDVAVNSGVGRARQWHPLVADRNPVDAVKAIGARRRAFFRSLPAFAVFGKGWMRRVNSVEAWSLAWAVRHQGGSVPVALRTEAVQAKRQAQAATGGAAATGSGMVAAPQVEAVSQIDWLVLGAVGAPFALLFGFLIFQAVMQAHRAKAMLEAADV
ncbi:MAG: glycoside hydrolase family 108 protein [Rhizobiales bacterium]|nr:glycoside hydrolase family 108 protein [Hyphomicrobiales bacterium]